MITESLSLATILTPVATLLAWVAVAIGAAVLLRRAGASKDDAVIPGGPMTLGDHGAGADAATCVDRGTPGTPRTPEDPTSPRPFRYDTLTTALVLTGVAAYATLTLLVAVMAQPNTWDSMTYHLPRVMHWVQNGSVAHYPTHITRQLWISPGAEFALLQLQLLSGADGWANLVQWFSLIGCVVGASLLAKDLGADLRGQVFAAAACISIPMAVLQATSTQTDLVVALWLVCFAHFSLRLIYRPAWPATLCVGAALALAVLTKGTAFFFAPPLGVWLVVSLARSLRWSALKHLLVIGLMVGAVNVGHWGRNFVVFGDPVTTDGIAMANEVHGWRATASNVVRNAALHLRTGSPDFNAGVEARVRELHALLGFDVNDGRTTFLGTRFGIPGRLYNEGLDGNPLHFLLIACAAITVLSSGALRRSRGLVAYATSWLVAFLLFCWVLKWQPYHSRLHTPLFILLAPVVALALARWRPRWLGTGVMLAMLLHSVPWLLYNATRPLVGPQSILNTPRASQLFAARRDLHESFVEAARSIEAGGCRQVGLVMGVDNWEYPLWKLLATGNDRAVRIEHVEVGNRSRGLPLPEFEPCAVITVFRLDPATVRFPPR